jgi:hypothetical protein
VANGAGAKVPGSVGIGGAAPTVQLLKINSGIIRYYSTKIISFALPLKLVAHASRNALFFGER